MTEAQQLVWEVKQVLDIEQALEHWPPRLTADRPKIYSCGRQRGKTSAYYQLIRNQLGLKD